MANKEITSTLTVALEAVMIKDTEQQEEDQRKNELETKQHKEYETMDNGTEVNKANKMVLVTIGEVRK